MQYSMRDALLKTTTPLAIANCDLDSSLTSNANKYNWYQVKLLRLGLAGAQCSGRFDQKLDRDRCHEGAEKDDSNGFNPRSTLEHHELLHQGLWG
jgi:hypothetical protein